MTHRYLSIVIIAFNAETHLPLLLKDLTGQTVKADQVEILLVDGRSTDGTRTVMQTFAEQHPEFSVKVLDNLKRIQSAGRNLGIAHATGQRVLLLDTHIRLPEDFVQRHIDLASAEHPVVAGKVVPLQPDHTEGKLIYCIETSPFGSGGAPFRNLTQPAIVDTLAFGSYPRALFGEVGGFDERLVRSEDNELSFRIRKAGHLLYVDPTIVAYRQPRENLVGFFRQMAGNGLWVGLTMAVEPRCFRLRHFVPFLFLTALLATTVLATTDQAWLLALLLGVYGSAALYFSFKSGENQNQGLGFGMKLCLPLIFLMTHLTYGVATLTGLLAAPGFAWKQGRVHEEQQSVKP